MSGGVPETGYWYPKSRPKEVRNGIKAKSRHGKIGEKWWSEKWIAALESIGLGSRLARGKNYARRGQVVSIDILQGVVKAGVQGSRPRPYEVTIRLKQFSARSWNAIDKSLASKALFSARLLGGEMPQDIDVIFREAGLPLFPSSNADLQTSCSCPDWENPCKHVAAVYYILAERFDEDPFLIFSIRGQTEKETIERIGRYRKKISREESVQHPEDAEKQAPDRVLRDLEERIADFWNAGEGLKSFQLNPYPAESGSPVLRRLGEGPYLVRKKNMSVRLSEIYRDASRNALKMLLK
jgi:uncharacterized Zn finger protein